MEIDLFFPEAKDVVSALEILDSLDPLARGIAIHLSSFDDLTPNESSLTNCIINDLPIKFTDYNLRCLLLGYLLGSCPHIDEAIDFILSNRGLSRFCWNHIDEFKSFEGLVQAYLSQNFKYRTLPGYSHLFNHDRPYKKTGRPGKSDLSKD